MNTNDKPLEAPILTKKGTVAKQLDKIGNKHAVGNKGKPCKYTPRKLKEKINAYIEQQKAESKPITLTGIALATNIDRGTLHRYKDKTEYYTIIRDARLQCEDYIVSNMLTGKTPSHSGAFLLKNGYGYTDKHEVKQELTGNFNLTSILDNLDSTDLKRLNDNNDIIDQSDD